jgi:hypothetical protein
VHWPLIDFECGPNGGADDFLEWFFKADRGELEPFVLVVEGSIPNERSRTRATGAASATTRPPGSRSPPASGSTGWPRRHRDSRRRHLRDLRRHPRDGRQSRPARWGLPDYLGWELEVQGRHPDRLRAGLPDPAGQPLGDPHLPALHGDRPGTDDPARRSAAADLAVRQTRSTRVATAPATTSRPTSRPSTAPRSASSSSVAGGRS